jgi:hypothetical protein
MHRVLRNQGPSVRNHHEVVGFGQSGGCEASHSEAEESRPGSRVRLRGRNAVRGQHAWRRIGERIGESRARHGDEVVAVGAAALAEEQQRLGVAGTAERTSLMKRCLV